MRWAVEIQKTGLDRRSLVDLLAGLNFVIVKGVESDAFYSESFDDFQTVEAVWSEAKRLRASFAGPARVDPEFELGAVISFSSRGTKRHHILEVDSVEIRSEAFAPTVTVSPALGLSEAELVAWHSKRVETEYQAKLESQREKLEPAFWNSNASKVLELLEAEKPTGVTVYKLYELMEGHPSNRSTFHRDFGIAANDFNRFKDAVHNPVVSADWARHAYNDAPKTVNPMSIEEAKAFVRTLARQWLAWVRATRSTSSLVV